VFLGVALVAHFSSQVPHLSFTTFIVRTVTESLRPVTSRAKPKQGHILRETKFADLRARQVFCVPSLRP